MLRPIEEVFDTTKPNGITHIRYMCTVRRKLEVTNTYWYFMNDACK